MEPCLLAGEPGQQNRGHFIAPRHDDGTAARHDDDRPRVGRRDAADGPAPVSNPGNAAARKTLAELIAENEALRKSLAASQGALGQALAQNAAGTEPFESSQTASPARPVRKPGSMSSPLTVAAKAGRRNPAVVAEIESQLARGLKGAGTTASPLTADAAIIARNESAFPTSTGARGHDLASSRTVQAAAHEAMSQALLNGRRR